MNIKRLENMPDSYPRVVDLLPLLSRQKDLDSDLQVNMFKGTASVSIGKSMKDKMKSKEHDLTFTRNSINRQKTDIVYNGGDVSNTINQNDIWEDTMDYLGAIVPEVTICNRLTVEDIPKSLEGHKDLQGLDYICLDQHRVGNYYRMLKRKFGFVGAKNPYPIIKASCLEHNVWDKTMSKYLRSSLKTKKVLGIAGRHCRGWRELFTMLPNRAFPPLTSMLGGELVKNKWWSDVAIPRRFLVNANGSYVEGTISILREHREIVAI